MNTTTKTIYKSAISRIKSKNTNQSAVTSAVNCDVFLMPQIDHNNK